MLASRVFMGGGNGNPLQYSCLENPTGGGAWWAAVHGVVKSRTRLIDFTFPLHFHALEKEMATHSSVLVWRIPRTGEPGGLSPRVDMTMGSHRVGHDWSNLAAAAAATAAAARRSFLSLARMPCIRKQPLTSLHTLYHSCHQWEQHVRTNVIY